MRFPNLLNGHGSGGAGATTSRLHPLRSGGWDNPGKLKGFFYVPEGLPEGAPLVVVLHGCTQDAAAYDLGSGWSHLADRHGFALLFPEQSRDNNPNTCFNWFLSRHVQRGRGEVASIHNMTQAMVAEQKLDPARLFVTGLSAGGAMASALLAAYPDVYAGGAIIAGLPYGCARDVRQALDLMGGRTRPDAATLAAKLRGASQHQGPWPRISVWHGSADKTVVPGNADAVVAQWLSAHGLPQDPTATDILDGHRRRTWSLAGGPVLIEQIEVAGLAHGTPLRPGTGEGQSGQAGPHMLDAGISSTDHIAAFFGIAPEAASVTSEPAKDHANRKPHHSHEPSGVQKVIEDALRSAGLMR